MRGIQLARQLALLGAHSVVATPTDEIVQADQGWTVHVDRWQDLGQRLLQHGAAADDAEPDELRDRLHARPGLTGEDYWLLMLCGAVELYPDAAAAVSLVAEDERVHLVMLARMKPRS